MGYIVAPSRTKYVGYEADAKPSLTQAHAGTELTELDTGARFIWSGTEWTPDLTMFWAVKAALEEAV